MITVTTPRPWGTTERTPLLTAGAAGAASPEDGHGHVPPGFVCHIRGVTPTLRPARRRLLQVVAGVVCVVVVGFALWLVAGFAGAQDTSTAATRRVQATVTSTASCQSGDTQDSVTVPIAGVPRPAKLDGCGHARGERVAVLVPADFASGTVVEPADTAPASSSGMSHRVAFLLLLVAAVVGGGVAYRLSRIRHPHGVVARPAGRKFAFGAGPAEPDGDYHSGIRSRRPDQDEADTGERAGIDWFEDSATRMDPVPPPADLPEGADRS